MSVSDETAVQERAGHATPCIPVEAARAPLREPILVRFGLRQLFACFSLAVLMIALMAQVSIGWSIVVASLALLVAAHVFGTFVGTRLRDTSEDLQRWKSRPGSLDLDYPIAAVPPVSVAELCLPAPTLASYERIGRWRNWFIAAGTLSGVLLGGFAFHAVAGEELTLPGLALGSVSCGVLGSWASLLGVNFYAIARHTLRQASQDLARDRVRR